MSLDNYEVGVMGQECRAWAGQCISAAGLDTELQSECNRARQEQCGNQTLAGFTPLAVPSRPVTLSTTVAPGSSVLGQLSGLPTPNVGAAITSSSSDPPSSTSTSTSGSPASSDTDTATEKKGTPAGAIAGAVVGAAALGVLIWLLIRWRKKSKARKAPTYAMGSGYENDEKQVTYASHMPLDEQPELHGDPHVELHGETAAPYVAELESPPAKPCSGSNAQHYAIVAPTRSVGEMEGNTPPYSTVPAPTPAPPTPAAKTQYDPPLHEEVQELAPKTPKSTRRELSPNEVAALEEERRIDAELEEVRRMKELRDQKLAIQQKLRDAKKCVRT